MDVLAVRFGCGHQNHQMLVLFFHCLFCYTYDVRIVKILFSFLTKSKRLWFENGKGVFPFIC